MAGGLGTRLQPLTFSLPKPLLPVGERPIIEIIISQLRRGGFDRVFVSLGHKGHLIRAYLSEAPLGDIQVEYLREESPLGTAGALRMLPADVEDLFMINGDILTKTNFAGVLEGHRNAPGEASLTVVVHHHAVPLPYGVFELDGDDVVSIEEKPTLHIPVATGMYALDRRAIDVIPQGRSDMPDLINILTPQRRVRAHLIDEFWTDVADLVDYEQVHLDGDQWSDV